MTDYDHPMNAGHTEPSDEERHAWRKTARAALVLDWLKVVGIYTTLVFVIVLVLDGRDDQARDSQTIQAIRDTQTEGSPLLLAMQAQQERIEDAAKAAQAGLEQLQDCIEPKGECATRSRQRSAAYLQVIGYFITCSGRFTGLPEDDAYRETSECVARLSKSSVP